jgi:transcriptional regulator with XRE-family HTH domain
MSTLSSNNTVYGGFIILFSPAILGYMEEESVDNALVLIGRRIRTLRAMKGWTQQELGNKADINYKFLGEIERGKQNPSFNSLIKIVEALEVELPEFFRFEQEIIDRKAVETRINEIIKAIPDDALRQILLILRVLYPLR